MTGGAFTPETRTFLERVTNLKLLKPFTKEELDRFLVLVIQ
jgi:hypothetical protein